MIVVSRQFRVYNFGSRVFLWCSHRLTAIAGTSCLALPQVVCVLRKRRDVRLAKAACIDDTISRISSTTLYPELLSFRLTSTPSVLSNPASPLLSRYDFLYYSFIHFAFACPCKRQNALFFYKVWVPIFYFFFHFHSSIHHPFIGSLIRHFFFFPSID